jgi:hypothetical protein
LDEIVQDDAVCRRELKIRSSSDVPISRGHRVTASRLAGETSPFVATGRARRLITPIHARLIQCPRVADVN